MLVLPNLGGGLPLHPIIFVHMSVVPTDGQIGSDVRGSSDDQIALEASSISRA